jgi:Flp pilus assembly protein TadG
MMRSEHAGQRGFVLIAMAVSILAIVLMLGVAIDFGRAFITKNEAQAFTDSAALAAARELNGTLSGITAAGNAVTANANRWNLATYAFTGVITEFSTDRNIWYTAPGTGTGYRYVRVSAANNTLAIFFLSALGAGSSMNIAARTTAGFQPPTTYSQGVFPFAPLAHGQNAPHFGYAKGDELTLLWPSSVGSNGNVKMNNLCQSDRNQAALQAVQEGTTADRGYIQETSASAIAAAIEDDHMDYTVTLGEPVSRSGGVKTQDVNYSLAARVAQDTSPNVSSYDTYIANHDRTPLRRLVIVPIIDNAVNAIVLGFAYVSLPPSQPRNPNDAKCAMYVGPADQPAGGDLASGANIVRIVE